MLYDRRPGWTRWCVPAACALLLLCASVTLAQTPAPAGAAPSAAPTITAPDPVVPAPHGIDTGSTAWMLVSSALVLFMVPGLALFYGGMGRAKNVLNMFLCVMVAIGVIGLHWVFIGYALAFGGGSIFKLSNGWSLLGWDKSLLF